MRIFRKQQLTALVAVVTLATTLASTAETPRQYDIELVIFRNLVVDDGGELWPVEYPDWFEHELEPEEPEMPAGAVTWLPKSQFRLNAVRNALARSRPYRPLAHLAWRQSVSGRRQAKAVELPIESGRDGAYVDGLVRVAVARYLHLDLDLRLHLPELAETASSSDIDSSSADYGVADIRLKEQRRMRSKELHYFDHPRFGVIALITPYERPAPSADTEAPTQP
jgi:hypothetical protein